jgi:hypothetical protein
MTRARRRKIAKEERWKFGRYSGVHFLRLVSISVLFSLKGWQQQPLFFLKKNYIR